MQVSIKKLIIHNGCAISIGTKNPAVPRIIKPMINDLVAAAPTYPIRISEIDMGADMISYMVPINLGKNMPNDALAILCVSSASIISPGTMKVP